MDHAARTELFTEGFTAGNFQVTWIVFVFRFFLGIQVVQVAEKFIESMVGRQVFILIAEVVLAKLTGRITARFQQPGDSRLFLAVRNTLCPMMNDERPAVQLCSP